MEFERYIPVNPDFLAKCDVAFANQRAIYAENTKVVRKCAQLSEEGKNVGLVDENGEELHEVYAPEYMEFVGGEIDRMWQESRGAMLAAHSAQDQAGALLQLLKEVFNTASYTGNCKLMPRFFDAVVNELAAHYEDAAHNPATLEEDAQNIVRLGPTPHAFFQAATQDMRSYTELSIEALSDIDDLTEFYEFERGKRGKDIARSPYDLTLRRYCAARKLDIETFDQIPYADKDEFVRQMQKFYVRELFAPFAVVLPRHALTQEMAWFIGAAVSVVRGEEMAEHKQMQERSHATMFAARKPKRIHYMDADAANDNGEKREGFIEYVVRNRQLTKLEKPMLNHDNGRSTIEILRDPVARARMNEMLAEVFEDHPDMATNMVDIVAAKEYFIGAFMQGPEHEPEHEQSPSR